MSFESETGGLMFGKEDKVGNVIVFKSTNPDFQCIRSPSSFIIEEKFALDKVKENLSMNIDYIGNWHSHKGYGAHSHGDDLEAQNFLKTNSHQSKIISLVVDILGTRCDIYAVAYDNNGNQIGKKFLNLRVLPSKEIEWLARKYLSTLTLVRRICHKIEEVTQLKCSLLFRKTTREYILQIELKEIDNKSKVSYINYPECNVTVTKGSKMFLYISIPSHIDYVTDTQDNIHIGISSRDLTTDIVLFKFSFKHLIRPQVLISCIKSIIDSINRYVEIPLSRFLLREIDVN